MSTASPDPSAGVEPGDPLAGDWTIYRAAELHAVLRERFDAGCERIDLSGVESIDSAGLQLMIAARRSAERAGRTLAFVGAGEPVRALCADLAAGHLLAPEDVA